MARGERPSYTARVQTLAQIRSLLEGRGLAPRKLLGQNFLVDHNLIRKLVETANLKPGDVVLEIGPGTGALTEELLERGCEVIACELDRGLAQLLRERLGEVEEGAGGTGVSATGGDADDRPHMHSEAKFTLIEGDALASKKSLNQDVVRALGGRPFKLVANLPYGAGTPVMIAALVEHPECGGLFVTIQREVADRLLAQPNTKEYGPLAVLAQTFAEVKRIAVLPPECFWPRPEVTSAMVAVVRRADPLTKAVPGTPDSPDARRLADAVQQLFSRRRKQIGSILGREFDYPPEIPPNARIEALSVEQVLALALRMG